MNHADWMKYVGAVRIDLTLNDKPTTAQALGVPVSDVVEAFKERGLTFDFLKKVIAIDLDSVRAAKMDEELLKFDEMMARTKVYPFAQEAEDFMACHYNLDHLKESFPLLSQFFVEEDFRKFLIYTTSLARVDQDIKFTSILGKDVIFFRGAGFTDGISNPWGCPREFTEEFKRIIIVVSAEYYFIRKALDIYSS